MNISYPKSIAILYSDAKREYFPTQQQYISEAEVKDRAELIATYLEKMKIKAVCLPGNNTIHDNLSKYKPDFVLNLVDSVYGKEYLSPTIAGTLELFNIPYTGSGMMGLTINANKYLTKELLELYGITIPKYQLIKDLGDEIDPVLDFPLIAKLNEIHGSIEMEDAAICHDEKSLRQRINYLMRLYKQPVLIEEFIVGREVTAVITQGVHTKVYAAEKIFDPSISGKFKIVSFDMNWSEDPALENAITYQKYELPDRVKENIKKAFDILKMEDYGKFDLRVDESGRHYIIDCNANPALGPKPHCAIGNILDIYDISFDDILKRLITNTLLDQKKND